MPLPYFQELSIDVISGMHVWIRKGFSNHLFINYSFRTKQSPHSIDFLLLFLLLLLLLLDLTTWFKIMCK